MKRLIALLILPLCVVAACKNTRKTTATPPQKTKATTVSSQQTIGASAGVDEVTKKPKTDFNQGEELKIYWDLTREGSTCHNCGPVSYEIVRKVGANARPQMIVAPTLTSDWPIKLILDAKHFPQSGQYLVHVYLPNSSVSTDFSFTIK